MRRTAAQRMGVAVLLLVSAACGSGGAATPTLRPAADRDPAPFRHAEIELKEVSGSGVTGKADIGKAASDQTRLILDVDGLPGGRHAAHIHRGTCAKPLNVKISLRDVIAGRSRTIFSGGVQRLVGGVFSLAVHRTGDPASTHVACANLRDATWLG